MFQRHTDYRIQEQMGVIYGLSILTTKEEVCIFMYAGITN